jgi:quercetin dioxygenase-like cupin family protein
VRHFNAFKEAITMSTTQTHSGDRYSVIGDRITVLETGAPYEMFLADGPRDSGPPMHTHPWAESYYVLRGELEVSVDGKSQVVAAGCSATAPENSLHTFRYATDDTQFLFVSSGAKASAFFADMDEHVAPGVPTPETLPMIVEIAKRHGLTSPLFP